MLSKDVDIIKSMSEKDIARFWSKVEIKGSHECWKWMDHLYNGYGRLSISYSPKKRIKPRASRISFILHGGNLDDNRLVVCHRCDNPACVNPSHLFSGYAVDNMQDMVTKGRSVIVINNAKLTPAMVEELRTSNKPQKYFVEKFGLAKGTISLAKRGISYRDFSTESRKVYKNSIP